MNRYSAFTGVATVGAFAGFNYSIFFRNPVEIISWEVLFVGFFFLTVVNTVVRLEEVNNEVQE